MVRKNVVKAFTIIIFSTVFPFIFTTLWLGKNNQLPINDAANYLYTIVNYYQQFIDHGIFSGFKSFFLERGFRPIIFPNLAFPFVFAVKGDLYSVYVSMALLTLLSTTLYLYLYASLLVNRFSAFVIANMVALLPFIQSQILLFYAEAAFFPCLVGATYHLICSNYLRHKAHVIGFALLLSFAFLLRPVEALLHIIFVFSFFMWSGFQQKIFTSKEIFYALTLIMLGIFLFLLAIFLPYMHVNLLHVIDNGGEADRHLYKTICSLLIGMGICIFFCLSAIFHYQRKLFLSQYAPSINRHYLLTAVFIITAMVLMWFLPKATDTFQWIYRTSIGDIAKSTGSLTGAQFSWEVLNIYLHEEGLLVIIGAFCLSVFSLLMLKGTELAKIKWQPIIFLLLFAPLIFWEAFFTVQVVSRKLSVVFPVLIMTMLMLGLLPGRAWFYRVTFAVILLAGQFSLLMLNMLSPYPSLPLFKETIGYFITPPSRISPNPHDLVLDFLATTHRKNPFNSVALMVVPGTPDARHPVAAEPINPFLLSTLVKAKRLDYYANFVYFSEYSLENIKKLHDQYNLVFLSDHALSMLTTKEARVYYQQKFQTESNPNLKVFYKFLQHYANKTLRAIGFEVVSCVMVQTQMSGEYRACLLRAK